MVMFIVSELQFPGREILCHRPCRAKVQNKSHFQKCHKSATQPATAPKEDIYQVNMDIQEFSPEDITVKTLGRDVIVEANHEEREVQGGLISRRFVRRYNLPDGYLPEDVTSSLSSDGVLSIKVPKSAILSGDRVVPIDITGPISNMNRRKSKDESPQNKPEEQIEKADT